MGRVLAPHILDLFLLAGQETLPITAVGLLDLLHLPGVAPGRPLFGLEEDLSLGEFLLAPDNLPLSRLPEVLRLSFWVQWGVRLVERFRPADLLYGIVLLLLFVAVTLAVWRALKGRWARA